MVLFIGYIAINAYIANRINCIIIVKIAYRKNCQYSISLNLFAKKYTISNMTRDMTAKMRLLLISASLFINKLDVMLTRKYMIIIN